MENTDKIFFKDSKPVWYIAMDNKNWIGPLDPADVVAKIESQEITWAHFAWKAGQPQWKRLCDIEDFQSVLPAQPNKIVQVEVKQKATVKPAARQATGTTRKSPPPAPDEEGRWFLHFNDAQSGPYSTVEVQRFIEIGKIHGQVYAWCDGMPNWERIKSIDAFEGSVAPSKKEARADKRAAPRFPLVARILLSSGEDVTVAMCRDISVGGMQVLTDHIPGHAGSKIKMNVSPSGAGKPVGMIEPFVAEGVIVRLLEDGRGFSFRFERLTDGARKTIENYIKSVEL